MIELRTFIHAEASSLRSPRGLLNALNEFLYEDLTRSELFITMFYLNYDAQLRQLSFANAGHNLPIIWRADSQRCEYIDTEGLILGIKRNVSFEQKQLQLFPGDVLLLYTDGVTEAADQTGELFGEERLCRLLAEYHLLPPQQIIENLLFKVRSFAGSQNLIDDASLVVMRAEK